MILAEQRRPREQRRAGRPAVAKAVVALTVSSMLLPALVFTHLRTSWWRVERTVAAQPSCNTATIAAPGMGDGVSGQVRILGSAAIDDFQFYKLEWATTAEPETWIAVSEVIDMPVRNGLLDIWTTTAIPDGRFRLKLTVVDRDSQERCRAIVEPLLILNLGPPEPSPTPRDLDLPTVVPGERDHMVLADERTTGQAVQPAPVVEPETRSDDDEDEERAVDRDRDVDTDDVDTDGDRDVHDDEDNEREENASDPATSPSGEPDDESATAVTRSGAPSRSTPAATRASIEPVLPRGDQSRMAAPAGWLRTFYMGMAIVVALGAATAFALLRRR